LNPPDLRSILPVSAGGENIASPVITADGQYGSFVAPVSMPALGLPQPVGNAVPGLNVAPVVAIPQAPPEFLAPTGPSPPALQPQAATWSAPQSTSGSQPSGSSNTIDDVRTPSTDQYDMPLNQLGQ
ncbi:MAG TPA: hypothetical protein VMR25_22055, partial [Planctomycetaceae bacterium]|nr:hypothetical protein [Planctomycetaceae bacterium]